MSTTPRPAPRRRGDADAFEELTGLTVRERRDLERQLADLKDPTRYLLSCRLTPRHSLYYNLSDDTYSMNDPKRATLFKRRAAAKGVQQLLGGGVAILKCRVNARGELALRSLPRARR